MIDPSALKCYLAQIERNLAEMPIEVLQEAKRRQDIDKHNAMIDQLKHEKKMRSLLARID